jgi:hypothetical protein
MAKATPAPIPAPAPASRLQQVLEIGHRQRQELANTLYGAPSENERMLRVAQAEIAPNTKPNIPTPAATAGLGGDSDGKNNICLSCLSCVSCIVCCPIATLAWLPAKVCCPKTLAEWSQ